MSNNFGKVFVLWLAFFCMAGCGMKEVEIDTKNDSVSGVPNPAAQKCVEDGYILEPILENGVPIDSVCVNPDTGRKCEVWKYFRDECSLK
ncbi:MAG: hypothetical protein DRI57_02290 [Deltaproteobacteria bacterium]|nr:MAG: hypothetical protein DRI57_02290 [Deltaproteobacteria bacterium]